jgi:hypothetical protein
MVPMDALLKVNGWDEMYDGSRQLEDADMIVRLAAIGQMMAYDNRARIIEYECGAYGDVVDTNPIKCNGAYAQYVWSLPRHQANKLAGEELDEAIKLMHWQDCIRYRDEKCWPHDGVCTEVGDREQLERIYRDQRICFDIANIRDNMTLDERRNLILVDD